MAIPLDITTVVGDIRAFNILKTPHWFTMASTAAVRWWLKELTAWSPKNRKASWRLLLLQRFSGGLANRLQRAKYPQ